MKIYIGKYRDHWLSPYTVLEKVFFWREIDYDEPIIKRWADRLEPFSRGLQKVLDVFHPKINYVKIDKWDTWSMDTTLAHIVLPMLKQLKATKHGSHLVDAEDVPRYLQMSSTEEYSNQLTFDYYKNAPETNEVNDEIIHKRWEWVLDEMIFAFEHKVDDSWEQEFHSGIRDIYWEKTDKKYLNPCTNEEEHMFEMKKGPNDTYVYDFEGHEKVRERMVNGFRLFGKYYEGLWD
jgi:hypothetical protein